MKKWILYNITVGFALYWTGNILLWYPWSLNASVGIALMFTIMPLFWGFGIYLCLISYNGKKLLTATVLTSCIIVIISAVLDYIFFGLIRGTDELYKPSTFYGYGFLALLPFIEVLFFKKVILQKKRNIHFRDFAFFGIAGLASLTIQIIVINT